MRESAYIFHSDIYPRNSVIPSAFRPFALREVLSVNQHILKRRRKGMFMSNLRHL